MCCVTVDDELLAAEDLGLRTVGQVLSHVRRDTNRLVVDLRIDGREPGLDQIGAARRTALDGLALLLIRTAEPRAMALAVVDGVEAQLGEADRLGREAAELLRRPGRGGAAANKAVEKLSGYFTTWQHAEESVRKTVELLRLDPASVSVDSRTLSHLLDDLAGLLGRVRSALESRDLDALADVLAGEARDTAAWWSRSLAALRAAVGAAGCAAKSAA